MGTSKKTGRTLFTDFAYSATGAESTRDTTFFEGIDITRREAYLPDGAIRSVEILEWEGPGGGWPYIKLTFDTQESLVRWSWVMWDGDPVMLENDLGFSPRTIELVEPWWDKADSLRGIAASGVVSKYERRCLEVIADMVERAS